jgi:hypothetical protein
MHGGGGPKGKGNERYRTGLHTAELIQARRLVRALARFAKDAVEEEGSG